ncbi:MAG: glycosyltransferase [Bacteroidales bacterium]|nr:glycosyltransferase [Bacteroidales bacterium]
MQRFLVLGAFGYDTNQLDGQTVKTRNVFRLLQENHAGRVDTFDTIHVRKNPFSLFKLLWYLLRCNTLIIIPCLNNLTVVFPVTYYLSKIFRYDIIHICIGGWQVEYFKGNERFEPHPLQLKLSKKIKAFMPEMVRVDNDLKAELGFTNTEMFPNFRFMTSDAQQMETTSETLRLVFLARVDKNKGYDTIFNFAKEIEQNHYNVTVDFYGPINEVDKDEFLALVERYHSCVNYKGVLQQDEVVGHLTQYDVMLLPTTIYTEGFPGSVLDAYMAGIPVIATEWKHSHEFIDDEKTGFIIPFDDCQQEFNKKILSLYNDRVMLSEMKKRSFQRRTQYSDKTAWSVLSKYL